MSTARAAVLLLLCAVPAPASADWLITPFLGLKFAGDSSFVELDGSAGATKLAVGASVALLSDGLFGIEADVAYVSRFFEQGQDFIASSGVTTVTGNLMVAAPKRLTQYSLRPYLVGGVGLMRVDIDDVIALFDVDSNLLCLGVGGGAIGPLTERVSVRFEARHFRNLRSEEDEVVGFGNTRLKFWRATVGVFLRY